MTAWAIDVRIDPHRRDSLAAWLVARTGHGVEERADGTLVSFATDDAAADALLASLRSEQGPGLQAGRRALEEIDWATRWREGLGPRRFGRLTLVPSWVVHPPAPGESVVVLDPEGAFGSGEHGSTRAALRLLVTLIRLGDFVLDLGSGSGILAIAAARLGAQRAVGIEQDGGANVVALRNAERNGVADRVSFIEGDATLLAPLVGPAHLVLSNVLRSVNLRLLSGLRAALCPGGRAIFSGMELGEAAEFRGALAAAGLRVVTEVEDAGWWAVATTPL